MTAVLVLAHRARQSQWRKDLVTRWPMGGRQKSLGPRIGQLHSVGILPSAGQADPRFEGGRWPKIALPETELSYIQPPPLRRIVLPLIYSWRLAITR
jgi:hypothetical protein